MKLCFSDTETWCETPIKNGAAAYSEKAEVMLWTYAFDDGEIKLWDLTSGAPMPEELKEALDDPEVKFVWHNSFFDLSVIREHLGIDIPINRVHCTMAQAYAHGLPGSLGTLCEVFNLPVDKAKDKEGKKLIQLFCCPRKTGNIKRCTSKTHPLEWERFCNYAIRDIGAMREVFKKMPNWNYVGNEYDLWCLDAAINRRGYKVDMELCEAALRAVDKAQRKLALRTEELSLGDLASTSQRDETLRHILQAYGVELPDLQASTIERRMDDPDLPVALKELLGIRLQVSTTSTAKYRKVLNCVSSDGRLRGTLQWCGAARTGRDSGRLFQPQNLPRPTIKDNAIIEFGIEAMKSDCADLFFDNVMELASNAIRGVIVAEPGNKLLVADLANIEGRYAAWIANEEWKLQAFRDYDTILGMDKDGKPIRKGHDAYKLSYAKSFRVAAESVTKEQRDSIGKPLELSMQFGGGCGAFITFALNANVDLEKLVKDAWDTIPSDVMEEAKWYWDFCVKNGRTMDLDERVFLTCDSLKRMWRRAHPAIVATWANVESNIREAIETKGVTRTSGKLSYRRDGNWLRIIQPGGRSLSYPSPRVDNEGKISFMGVDQYSRKWTRISSYGPKFFENIIQGGARNVFMRGVVNTNTAWTFADNPATATRIHDEQICQVPDNDNYTVKKLCGFMTKDIEWAPGLPLAAEGYETKRYRKA